MERLSVIRGPTKGKKYKLEEGVYRIGSGAECDIGIAGELVGSVHAVLELRADGVWELRNQSINGTFVNRQRIDEHALSADDVVQIGAETLIRFEQKLSKAERRATPSSLQGAGVAAPKPSAIKPWMLVAGGIYLAGMIAAAMFLLGVGSAPDSEALSPEVAENVVARTEQYLRSPALLATASAAPGVVGLDPRADPSYDYFSVLELRQAGKEGAEVDALIAGINERVRGHLFRAWTLESQRKWREAAGEYRSITELLPDIRAPATQFSTNRIDVLYDRFLNE